MKIYIKIIKKYFLFYKMFENEIERKTLMWNGNGKSLVKKLEQMQLKTIKINATILLPTTVHINYNDRT